MLTILLLIVSNFFMTFAWYGHLKFKESPLAIAILVVEQLCLEGFITSPTRKRGLHFRQRFALACASGSLLNNPAISSCPTTRNPHNPAN